ncbi:sulfite exporter TauE/SafE family protein [Thorsellia anophelis]|uniref:Probable membrane transporter protein n=1 Tax=Thorsellia anophelis DSM 18579 TaxID=1123402 RepID=A0A1I0ASP5_9GAMM|nr:sulfite exporter TauE/SafE family protein [Thorsellia anophelis]SES97378.1 Sulfite exporter TauE/SafE [Thorsellia anophelis DSM 18579]
MNIADISIFLICVFIACFTQNLTGFAFGLIFLGLTSLFGSLDLLTAANVISILSLANAIPMLKTGKATLPKKPFFTCLSFSLIGVASGLWLLHFLSRDLEIYLKLLLGITILVASFLLIIQRNEPVKLGKLSTFGSFGFLSGILGGLFSTAGPPLVYLLYRQPLTLESIKRFLVLSFAANALLRTILVAIDGQLSLKILTLCAIAFPFVCLQTFLQRKYPIKWPIHRIKKIVFGLLLLTAASILIPNLLILVQHTNQ